MRIVAMRQVGIASALHRQPIGEKLQREQQRERAQHLVLALDLDSDVDCFGQRRTGAGIDAEALRADSGLKGDVDRELAPLTA